VFGADHANTIKIGWVGPRSGPLAIFGEADVWLTDALKANYADGITIGDTTYGIEVI